MSWNTKSYSPSGGSQLQNRNRPCTNQELYEIGGSGSSSGPHGFLAGSSNVMVNKPIMIDQSQHITGRFDFGEAVFSIIEPFIIAEAAMDSNARDPPPRCHPGTRAQLHRRLESWLVDPGRLWNMIWLRGPAGAGKTAVAQTFAEHADDQDRLGGSFFFSRPNKRDKPLRVIPTLAYQLASKHFDYRALLTEQLVNNRLIFKATLRVQFKKLISEPFSRLVQYSVIREPLLVVLDGLDECKGEDAQCEIIRLISEAAQSKNKLPILWLVCSRPEPHITNTFSSMDFSIKYGREKLVLDLEARNDVDRYLRDGFKGVHAKYIDVIPTSAGGLWPSVAEFRRISDAAAGLFIFAATVLNYIGDVEYANPRKQLRYLLEFLDNSKAVGVKSPWDNLDLLYTRILSEISERIFPTAIQILGVRLFDFSDYSASALCNFLRLEQDEFYSALRRLHSVMEIPVPGEAIHSQLLFYHASFQDYLQDQARSRKYFIGRRLDWTEIIKYSLHWFAVPLDARDLSTDLMNGRLYAPFLSWAPEDDMEQLSMSTEVAYIASCCFEHVLRRIEKERDSDLISLILQCNFSNFIGRMQPRSFMVVMQLLYELDQRQNLNGLIIRTETSDSVDARHLEHLSLQVGTASLLKPAIFPVDVETIPGEEILFFFLGSGPNTCVVCYAHRRNIVRCSLWRGENQPSEEEVTAFRQWML